MAGPLASFFEELFRGETHAILTVATAYFVMTGLFGLILSIRIRSWPMARGTLIRSRLYSAVPSMTAGDRNYHVDLQYSYVVDDVRYEGHRLSPTYIVASANLRFLLTWQMRGISELGDDEIAVFYNPSAPEKSYLIRPGALSLTCIIGFMMLPAIFWI